MTKSEAEAALKTIRTKDSAYWEKVRQQRSLALFHRAAVDVPAYKDFLHKHKIDHARIIKYSDLSLVPHVTKNNYLRHYSLPELTWGGSLDHPLVYTSTSGSTGKPIYFHRSRELDYQSSLMHELYYGSAPNNTGTTLVIVCFGMGVWIGGLITYQAFQLMKERGYNISTITPGINKEEIFRALENLSPFYNQTILAGYPPFIKDIIDEAEDRRLDLKKLKLRLLCAAEPFTEKFRDYLVAKTGVNRWSDASNIYGTADLGTMAMETPTSVLIRTLATKNDNLFKEIFGDINKTPTLTQYIPDRISFDTENNGELIITGDNSIPLIRYAIGDHGGTYTFDELTAKLKKFDIDLVKEATMHGISSSSIKLPFVYVYERVDLSTTLYGLQVYPEPLREVFLTDNFEKYFTGKFTLETNYTRSQNQYLYINIELKPRKVVNAKARASLLKALIKQLETKNSEYRELHAMLGKRAWPKLVFWPNGDHKYFKPGIKQRWVNK